MGGTILNEGNQGEYACEMVGNTYLYSYIVMYITYYRQLIGEKMCAPKILKYLFDIFSFFGRRGSNGVTLGFSFWF